MKKLLFLLLAVLLFCSCAHVHYVAKCLPDKVYMYGFWGGLWHGFISPVSFIASLFNKDIAVFAVNNTGRWYTFGFLLGFGMLSGGSAKSTSRFPGRNRKNE